MKTSSLKIQNVLENSEAANDAKITLSLCDLADAITDAAKSRIPLSIQLWNAAAIAEYLVYKVSVVNRDIVTQPDFPERLEIGRGRWKAQDVIEWSFSKKRSTRSGRPRKT